MALCVNFLLSSKIQLSTDLYVFKLRNSGMYIELELSLYDYKMRVHF